MVVDVGCGSGLAVAEFAKTAKHATGIDFSPKFLEYAANYSKSQNITNATFANLDISALDVDDAGYNRAFDLVYTSITHAITGDNCLEKLMKMSRKYVYNTSLVHVSDSLAERISHDVFGENYEARTDAEGVFALINLLWLTGYYPEIHYYNDTRTSVVIPNEQIASELARERGHKKAVDEILLYLAKTGAVERRIIHRYCGILWDVTERDER
jgi:SAM-dependent methyltransferase